MVICTHQHHRHLIDIVSSNAIGGAWNSRGTGKMWNGLHTNLSKYTCRFSDFPLPDGTSAFPSVNEMHDYLEVNVIQINF